MGKMPGVFKTFSVGIADFRFHDLRHTFASQLLMAGVDLATERELLGHKTLTMKLGYSHLAPSHKINAVNLLDEKINYTINAQSPLLDTKKAPTDNDKCSNLLGGPSGTRTPNLLIKSQLLCQLS